MQNMHIQIRCFCYILPSEKDITSGEKTQIFLVLTVFLPVLNCGLPPGIIQSVAKTATCSAKIYYFLKFV